MKETITFTLIRPAKKRGGDRYENGGFVLYLPQRISRPKGTPLQTVKVTFEGDDK